MATPALAWENALCGTCLYYRTAPRHFNCKKHVDFQTEARDAACYDYHAASPQPPQRKPAA
jgi:hypothetical protein